MVFVVLKLILQVSVIYMEYNHIMEEYMKYKLKYLSAAIALAFSTVTFYANAADNSVTNGVVKSQSASSVKNIKKILSNEPSFTLSGNESFVVTDSWHDELGKIHTKFVQFIDGIKVYGTSITIHENPSDGNTLMANTDASNVYFISGAIAENSTENVPGFSANAGYAKQASIAAANVIGDIVSEPELAYVYLPLLKETKLAYRIEVEYNSTTGFSHDAIFFDASSAELLTRDALVFRSKKLKTYLMHNKSYSDRSRPGTLECSTGQACNDESAQRAHNGASKVYDFYKEKLGRNGIDNHDMTIVSSVHTGSRWNNAVWYNNQMFYGDGDGRQFTDLTKSFDVIAHELTHGVTQNTANLAYKNASGALNEAWSDIMGVSAAAYNRNSLQPDWGIGSESYTPNTAGDALRYMNNPTRDGYSTDYYPERIPFTNNPTDQNDRGGVHGNSGIANLAFALIVDGGTHPRNKTAIKVDKLGLEKAQKIFYRALTTYFNASTDFFQAKTGTAQAALDLYGEDAKRSVEAGWCAVGVGACADASPTADKLVLENGVTKQSLRALTGNDIVYTMPVPAHAYDVQFAINGGRGDADLYVKYGSTPTDHNFDCAPLKYGNAESCSMTQNNGTYYIRVKAYQSFSNVSLTGSYRTLAR